MVTCPLVSDTSHLIFGSCPSPRNFGLGFLQPIPHSINLALLLAFGSANTWQEDFHLSSFAPCPAHTLAVTGAFLVSAANEKCVRVNGFVRAAHHQAFYHIFLVGRLLIYLTNRPLVQKFGQAPSFSIL